MQPEAASISARWIAFADALPPIQDNGRGDTLRRKVLVTNNINARDAFGDPSHVWLGNPEHDKKHGWFVYDGGMFLTHWADPFTACVPTPSLADERTLVNEIFERQHAGFERCYEALGIADDRERSWSSLVMAINDALNARVEEADNETNYLRDTGRTIESVCGLPELEAGASEAVATLHDDGHYVWNPKVSKPDGYDRAGWKMPVYAAPQPTQADNQKGKK